MLKLCTGMNVCALGAELTGDEVNKRMKLHRAKQSSAFASVLMQQREFHTHTSEPLANRFLYF